MTGKGGGAKEATPTDSRIFLDGREVQFTAYNIDGNNYFKLRDIGEAFSFGVDWDDDRNTIVIDTSKGYSLDGGTTTPVSTPAPTPTPTPEPEPTPTPSTGGDVDLLTPTDISWYSWPDTNRWQYYLDFNSNGEFEYRVYHTEATSSINVGIRLWEELYQGTYSASNGTLALTYTSAYHEDIDKPRMSIALPENVSFSYEIGGRASEYWNPDIEAYDYLYSNLLDISGGLPPCSELFKEGMTFNYKTDGENYKGDMPTKEQLPWPSDLMPGVPEYGNGGIITRINTSSYSGNVDVIISETTIGAWSEYCDRVLQAGWVLDSKYTVQGLKNGIYSTLMHKNYDFTLVLRLQTDGNYSIYKWW